MWISASAARAAVALVLCLPAAVACDGGGSGGSGRDGDRGKGVDTSGNGATGAGDDGGVPDQIRVPEWGRNGFLFDDDTAEGRANWAEIKKLFEGACGDGTLCVVLERSYRVESGALTDGPCGYTRMDPAANTLVKRGGTVSVVGDCAPESEDPAG
ncbi:hypothetical protein [Streptomyces sp. NPDC048659]|uniref:hypothetical protein n=1 Tax=Streptomyces sp. NPDC048659 TaxID=3155489 RepID=UPI00344967B9